LKQIENVMKKMIKQIDFKKAFNIAYGIVGGYMILAMLVLVSMM